MASADVIIAMVDKERGNRVWHENQVFTGGDTTNKIVPNVDDLIVGRTAGWSVVTDVDYTTGLSTKTPIQFPSETGVSAGDALIGIVGATQSESYRVYINPKVLPYSLSFDSRLKIFAREASYLKLFLGYDISDDTGVVISAQYDASGQLVSDQVPLIEVPTENNASESLDNAGILSYTVKVPAVVSCNQLVTSGQPVTAVVYGSDGEVLSICHLLSYITSFVKGGSSSTRMISDISLVSPMLSASDPTVVEVPVNMPMIGVPLMGKVAYTNGDSRIVTIDNSKMSLFGLDQRIASVPNQVSPLVLTYTLSSDEQAVNAKGEDTKHLSATYSLRTSEYDGAYSVKLFVLPFWDADRLEYALSYMLFTADRSGSWDVTDYVKANTGSNAFKPSLYNTEQKLSVVLNLADADPSFSEFYHVQNFAITLRTTPDTGDTPWLLEYTDDNGNTLGDGLEALFTYHDTQDWSIDITCGSTTQADWLQRLYYVIEPLYYYASESGPIEPTHMRLIFNEDDALEFSISEWNESLLSTTGGEEYKSLIVEWIAVTESTRLHLGATALMVRHVIASETSST